MANQIITVIPPNYLKQIYNVESITQKKLSGATTIHFVDGDTSCFICPKDIREYEFTELMDLAKSKIYHNISSENPTGSTYK